MHLPPSDASVPPPSTPVLVTTREDIVWGRPIFKAPSIGPLNQILRSSSVPVFSTAPRFRASQRRRRRS